jgi:hypothetical protein
MAQSHPRQQPFEIAEEQLAFWVEDILCAVLRRETRDGLKVNLRPPEVRRILTAAIAANEEISRSSADLIERFSE